MNICSIIVTFNSDLDELDALIGSHPSDITVLIVDNSTKHQIQNLISQMAHKKQCLYIGNNSNVGIAAAQNIGIAYAISHGFTHSFFFDDDSNPLFNFFSNICTFYTDVSEYDFVCGVPTSYTKGQFRSVSSKALLMSSGSFCSLSIFKFIGGFDENLFMNYVDYEFGWRAGSALGSKVHFCQDACFDHSIGEGDRFGLRIPSPDAQYFHWRNTIYLAKYGHVPLNWKVSRLIALPVKSVLVFITAGDVFLRVSSILVGIFHGFKLLRKKQAIYLA